MRKKRGGNMATSTYGKQFSVRANKAAEFVSEMSKTVHPTLRKDFHSHSANLAQDTDLREKMKRALGNR